MAGLAEAGHFQNFERPSSSSSRKPRTFIYQKTRSIIRRGKKIKVSVKAVEASAREPSPPSPPPPPAENEPHTVWLRRVQRLCNDVERARFSYHQPPSSHRLYARLTTGRGGHVSKRFIIERPRWEARRGGGWLAVAHHAVSRHPGEDGGSIAFFFGVRTQTYGHVRTVHT